MTTSVLTSCCCSAPCPATPASPMTARQVSQFDPRILTVNRRNPSQVQLRVLRRFTYTELDSDAQYDKLLSAYAVAEWSEPLFNNRALFSDYYLNERLPELSRVEGAAGGGVSPTCGSFSRSCGRETSTYWEMARSTRPVCGVSP